jgi:FG-GAP-like repeat
MDGATVANANQTSSPSLDPSWKTAGTSDFNGDGKSDILWRNSTTGNIAIWTMNGNAITSSILTSTPTLASSWKTLGVADFSGDGKADILWRNDVDNRVVLWTMDGTNVLSSTATSTPTLAASWKAVGTGDFNGDGKADVLWRNDDGSIALWQMNGTAVTSTATSTSSLNSNWKAAGTGDFNGDGKTDVLWRNTTTNAAVVWTMDGANVVSSIATSTAGLDSTWQVADIADFSGDGKADILWSKNTGATTASATQVWTMNGALVISPTATSLQPLADWNVATSIV